MSYGGIRISGPGLNDAWMDRTHPADQKRLAAAVRTGILTFAPYVPLGQYFPPTALRPKITGQLKVPVFWNLQKACGAM